MDDDTFLVGMRSGEINAVTMPLEGEANDTAHTQLLFRPHSAAVGKHYIYGYVTIMTSIY